MQFKGASMFVALVLLMCAASVSCLEGKAARAGHRCCVGDQWHGTMQMSYTTFPVGSTKPQLNQATSLVDVDWTLKRERLVMSGVVTPGNYYYNVTVYQDYLNHKQYVVEQNGKCNRTDTKYELFPPCIPGDFTYGGRTTIGSGDNAVHEDMWSGHYDTVDVTMTVGVGDCTPLTMSVIESDPSGIIMENYLLYSNVVQDSLSGPNVLAIPPNCFT